MPMSLRRKILCLFVSVPLTIGGGAIIYSELVNGHVLQGRLAWFGPILVITGLIWIASDWLEL